MTALAVSGVSTGWATRLLDNGLGVLCDARHRCLSRVPCAPAPAAPPDMDRSPTSVAATEAAGPVTAPAFDADHATPYAEGTMPVADTTDWGSVSSSSSSIFFFVISIGSLVFFVIALVDIAKRPDWQWKMAGQEKILWLLLVILINFLAIRP